jgi:uncharacterized protein (DUF488 family)
MKTVSTIGYERAGVNDFIATLRMADVQYLIDVRERPLSRRKGFSKSSLAMAITEAGMEYIHMRGLGDPKEGRDAAKAGNFDRFVSIFQEHMTSDAYLTDFERLTPYAETGAACLMCYERDSRECHRRLLADELSDILGVKIRHLGVREGLAANGIAVQLGKSLNTS